MRILCNLENAHCVISYYRTRRIALNLVLNGYIGKQSTRTIELSSMERPRLVFERLRVDNGNDKEVIIFAARRLRVNLAFESNRELHIYVIGTIPFRCSWHF